MNISPLCLAACPGPLIVTLGIKLKSPFSRGIVIRTCRAALREKQVCDSSMQPAKAHEDHCEHRLLEDVSQATACWICLCSAMAAPDLLDSGGLESTPEPTHTLTDIKLDKPRPADHESFHSNLWFAETGIDLRLRAQDFSRKP